MRPPTGRYRQALVYGQMTKIADSADSVETYLESRSAFISDCIYRLGLALHYWVPGAVGSGIPQVKLAYARYVYQFALRSAGMVQAICVRAQRGASREGRGLDRRGGGADSRGAVCRA